MLNKLDEVLAEVNQFSSALASEIEEKRIYWLGKKGVITELFTQFRNVPAEEKKSVRTKDQ